MDILFIVFLIFLLIVPLSRVISVRNEPSNARSLRNMPFALETCINGFEVLIDTKLLVAVTSNDDTTTTYDVRNGVILDTAFGASIRRWMHWGRTPGGLATIRSGKCRNALHLVC